MMPKMKICTLWVLVVLLSGCACSNVIFECTPMEAWWLVERSWEYEEEACMELGKVYPLPDGRHELLVVEQADGEYSRCLVGRNSAGELVPLVEGERTFGFAVSRQVPQYLLVFDNYASRQNRVLLYKLSSSRPVLCFDGTEFDDCFGCRVAWSVASWNPQGILLYGNQEGASGVFLLLPRDESVSLLKKEKNNFQL